MEKKAMFIYQREQFNRIGLACPATLTSNFSFRIYILKGDVGAENADEYRSLLSARRLE